MKNRIFTYILLFSFFLIKFHDSIPHHHDLECYVKDIKNQHNTIESDCNEDEVDHICKEETHQHHPEHSHTLFIHFFEYTKTSALQLNTVQFELAWIQDYHRKINIDLTEQFVFSDASIPLGILHGYYQSYSLRGPPRA